GGARAVVDDMAFVVEVLGARRARLGIEHEQVLMRSRRMVRRGGQIGAVAPNEDLAIELRAEREGSATLARVAVGPPTSHQELPRMPVRALRVGLAERPCRKSKRQAESQRCAHREPPEG